MQHNKNEKRLQSTILTSYFSFTAIIKFPENHSSSLSISISFLSSLVQYYGEISPILAHRRMIYHLHCEAEYGEQLLLQNSQRTVAELSRDTMASSLMHL